MRRIRAKKAKKSRRGRRSLRRIRARKKPSLPSPKSRPKTHWSEHKAAAYVVENRDREIGGLIAPSQKGHRRALNLDPLVNQAYWLVYPDGPKHPNFYDASQIDYINAWVRIRDLIDWMIFVPKRKEDIHSRKDPLRSLGAKFAHGDPHSVWPVISTDPRGCDANYLDLDCDIHGMRFQRFGAPRGGQDPTEPIRYHIGHDCIANAGDIVVAPERSAIAYIKPFYSGTNMMVLWTAASAGAPHGFTIILGEIAPDSNLEFGIDGPMKVEKGQSVARVGTFNVGAQLPFHMLHFETWEGQRKGSGNWYDSGGMPKGLLNPTAYLLRAKCGPELGLKAPMPEAQVQTTGRVVMALPNFPH